MVFVNPVPVSTKEGPLCYVNMNSLLRESLKQRVGLAGIIRNMADWFHGPRERAQ